MAARGTRNMDTGEEKVDDEELVAALRRKARKIHLRSLITAAAVSLLALAFP